MEETKIFDHHELRRAFHSVTDQLDSILSMTQPTDATCLAAVRAVERLQGTLEAHFRYEEAETGFFAEVLSAAPERLSELDKLRADHPALAAELQRLVTGAKRAEQSLARWQRLSEEFTNFRSDLQRHEHAEDAVVADALVTDAGGSG
jgi:iron-sulfur cluster repair protein YtfE (RIC family)